jgi:hypothetical protein
MKKDNGILLYADILGYRSFMSHTDTTDPATDDVIQRLENCAIEAKDDTLRELPVLEEISYLMTEFTPRIFSDTIIAAWPIPKTEDKLHTTGRWIYALTFAYRLHDHMLTNGLPIRGSVTIGDFAFSERCFAGPSLIEAYDLAGKIDASAIAVTDRAYTAISEAAEYGKNVKFWAWISKVLKRRAIPMKNGVVTMHALGFSDGLRKIATDPQALSIYVYSSFAKWHKQLSPDATRKADNTIALAKEMKII